MNLQDYDYFLPKALIAQSPASQRSLSKLLVVNQDKYTHKTFENLVDYLKKDDVLVINESKVVPAKLVGNKNTGGKVTVILTGKRGSDYTAICTRRVKPGMTLSFDKIQAAVLERKDNFVLLRFNRPVTYKNLAKFGEVPIPPYVRQPLKDSTRYQTVYAKKDGSIAAHTAGLHFDKPLLAKIRKKGVKIAKVCLHISYATFFPIRTKIEEHKMHPEYCEIDKKNADIINNRKGRLFVVGTTVVKSLESLSDNDGILHPGSTESKLFIYPGYRFKIRIDALVTNFHLPKSTLILLVSAFYGRENILNAYKEAIRNNYRFYSFGDVMLLLQ